MNVIPPADSNGKKENRTPFLSGFFTLLFCVVLTAGLALFQSLTLNFPQEKGVLLLFALFFFVPLFFLFFRIFFFEEIRKKLPLLNIPVSALSLSPFSSHFYDDLHLFLKEKGMQQLEERKRTENILKHYEEVLDSIDVGVAFFSSEKRLLFINKKARDIFQLSEDDTLARATNTLKNHVEIFSLLQGETKKNRLSLKKEDQFHDYHLELFSLDSGESSLLLQDVTKEHEMEKMKADLAANVSHELKTPLTSISSAIELLAEAPDDIEPSLQKRCLDIIQGNANRMKDIVHDLILLSSVESERGLRDVEEINIEELLHTICNEMKEQSAKNNITLREEFPENLPLLEGHRRLLHHLFSNLVSNAINYNKPHGSVTLSARYDEEKQLFHIAVKDTGIGIPSDVINRITERFFRVDKGRSRHIGGTGLGLSIVKNIAEKHQGSIHVESVLDVGSTVTLTLPLSQNRKI